MDNRTIARHLRMIANLFEVQDEHGSQCVRYRTIAEQIRAMKTAVCEDPVALSALCGADEDICRIIQLLHEQRVDDAFALAPLDMPRSLREVLELPGVGPGTTRTLYEKLNIASLSDLDQLLTKESTNGNKHLGHLHWSPKRTAELRREVTALYTRKRLIPLEMGQRVAARVLRELRDCPFLQETVISGSIRRMAPLSEHVTLLSAVASNQLADAEQWLLAQEFSPVDAHTLLDQHATDALIGMLCYTRKDAEEDRLVAVCLCLVKPEKMPRAWVFTTGDANHNEAFATLEQQRPTTKRIDGTFIAVGEPASEHDVYRTASLPFVEPELREGLCLTKAKDAATLIRMEDIKGDLHMHSEYSDGRHTIEEMVQACVRRGYEYMTITDHSQSLTVANGLSPERLRRQHEEICRMREKYPEITIFHGAEVDISARGELDFEDAILSELDLVVASIHTAMRQSKAELTSRILYAIASPHVDIIAHPTGRMLGRRDPYPLDFDQVFAAASSTRIALECNANPNRLDLDPQWLRWAVEADCLFSIDSDAHSVADLSRVERFGIPMARKGWLTPDRVINSWPKKLLLAWLNQSFA